MPPLRSAAPPHNLPLRRARLIGREREVAEACALLRREDGGLLTLTGPGGVGKTRLALAVAAEVLDEHPEGVWLVELAPLAEPALVPGAVAAAVGVREQPGEPPAATLGAALRDRRMLVLLDNCEHLADACATLADHLLRSCPDLRLLATSREPLRAPGEVVLAVPPLALPAPGAAPPPAALPGYAAVRLFLERARAAQPAFALTERNARAVVAICRRLDGQPLALELAAARLPALGAEGLAARLGDALRLLTAGSRAAPVRQRTLRATLDWSHGLLRPEEQVLFRRLAVFAGGWDLAAAEAVGGGDALPAAEVLAALAGLVDKSLVLVEHSGDEARYRLLEPVRQYAGERLCESGEEARLRRRHAAHYTALAEGVEPALWRARMTGALAWLEAEHDNVRAALRWALDAGEATLALRLTGAVFRFWMVRGYVEEGRRWLAAALDAGRDQPPALRAKVLNGAGSLAHTAGDPAAAIALYEEALAPRHEIESKRFIAGCLHNLGIALVHGRGDLARAEDALLEALTLYREAGDAWGVGLSLKTLGQVAVLRGAAAEGIARLEESVATYRRLESGWGLAIALIEFGNALLEAGDAALAWARQAEGLALAWADGDLLNITYALEGIARASLALGQPALAARLCGAAEALREAGGAPMSPPELARHEWHLARARAYLDAAAFAAAWGAGRALPLDEAVALALQAPAPPDPAPRSPAAAPAAAPAAGTLPAGLTPREADVLRLLAGGRSNQEIADALHLSVRTVERHIGNLYGKIAARGRADATAFALRHRLLADERDASGRG